MSLYDVDFKVLTRIIVFVKIRGVKLLAFLDACIQPFVTVYSKFLSLKKATDYEAAHNSQVCKLEAKLNDVYDAGLRRIKVVDGSYRDPVYFYNENEEKPVFIYKESENNPIYMYRESETMDGADFVIQIPSFITYSADRINALVNRDKLPSKTFIIQTI